MTKRGNIRSLTLWVVFSFVLAAGSTVSALAQDKTPVIIIPGITGSELVNSKTGEVVWYKAPRPKGDGLRLPISTDLKKVRDDLVSGDVLRSVKFGIFPRIDVYGGLIEALETRAGYHEEFWDTPTERASESSIFVFPYDWRLDNVGNARLLVQRIVALKVKLKKPNLKFNIIAHSMGGIIARYAAMYGNVDLPAAGHKARPTWAGAVHFDKIVLLGTPNEGSVLTLNGMLSGFQITGITISLPWIQNLSRYDVFTIPAVYQLLPAPGTFRVLDENLEPLNVDLYDPKQWSKYGWNAIDDKSFSKQFTHAEQKAAPAFLAEMLTRAKHLHEALAAGGRTQPPVSFALVGAECKDSLESIVMFHDRRSGRWRTLFKPSGFTKESGVKVSPDELKKIMLGPGDGVVSKRSFETDTQSRAAGIESVLRPASTKFVCEDHYKLAASKEVQDYLIELLMGIKPDEKTAVTAVTTATVTGTSWQWISEKTPKETVVVPDGEKYSIEFGQNGEVAATVACNSGTGKYKMEGASITISPIVTTRKACKNASLAARFIKSLSVAGAFRIEGDALYIDLPADAGTMKFLRINK